MIKLSEAEVEKIIKNTDYLEPETIRMLRGEDTTSLQVLKDLTYNIIKNTKAPFVDFYVFENVVHVLNDIEPQVDIVQGTTPEQIWWALIQIQNILGKEPELSHEVRMYIRFIYKNEGCLFFPPFGLTENDDNSILPKVIERHNKGSLIESDDVLENQAIKYARIKEYINLKNNK